MYLILDKDFSFYFFSETRPLEVYNRYFWRTLFTCNFQINKKAYLQTLNFLPITPNISMTPIHTKK